MLSHDEIEAFRDEPRDQGQPGHGAAPGAPATARGAAVLTAGLRLHAAWLHGTARNGPAER